MKQLSLSIPKPCHENWAAMTPEDKGRFCAACQKTVIDFTAMTDAELAQFFKKPAGSVCGRFDSSQLDRMVDVPRKRLPWIKYFFGMALPALLFSKKAAAQGEVRPTLGKVAVCMPSKPSGAAIKVMKPPAQELRTITGVVSDASGMPIPGVSVVFKNTTRGVVTNTQGEFELKQTDETERELIFSSVGYERKMVAVDKQGDVSIVLTPLVSGEVVITHVSKKKKAIPVPFVPKKSADEVSPAFTVYPNPVPSNSTFTVAATGVESGDYTLQIMTVSGDVLQTKRLALASGTKLPVTLGAIFAGSYLVRLTHVQNKKSFTETIVVQ